MGLTIAEKILSAHAGREVRAGDFAICKIDFAFGQDGTSSIIIDRLKELGVNALKTDFCMVIDHNAPSPSEGVSRIHKRMRDFSREYGNQLYDIGCGVCHQVIPESGKIMPGGLVLGADSHTCTYGALGAFSTGVGSTDLAIAVAYGKNWFKVPETIKIIVNGKARKGIYAKDIILHIIGDLTANGATYKAVEFSGTAIDAMDMDGRFTVCNMLVEMGAKAGFMPVDKKTIGWFRQYTGKKGRIPAVTADPDARYSRVVEFDVSSIKEPLVSVPHSVDTVSGVRRLKSVRIQEAFLGTCTNGRLSDLKVAASIVKSKRVANGVRFIVAPSSRPIFMEALRLGIVDALLKAGAVIVAPGCGPCVGTHNGIPADGETVISSANRNFKGRMGNPKAFIYLGSPATVAASAVEGNIADPRKYL